MNQPPAEASVGHQGETPIDPHANYTQLHPRDKGQPALSLSQLKQKLASPSKTGPTLGPALCLKFLWSLSREGGPESLSLREVG